MPPGPRQEPFPGLLAANGPRASVSSVSERVLLARLELTGFQRCAREIFSHQSDVDGCRAFWLHKRVLGVPIGVTEGVALRESAPMDIKRSIDLAYATGSGILKLTSKSTCPALPRGAPKPPPMSFVTKDWTLTRAMTHLREVLPLGKSYDDTLAKFGRHTRRNIRNARKAAAAESFQFEFVADRSELSEPMRFSLARRNTPHAIDLPRMRRFEAYAELAGKPFRTILRSRTGAVISYCCGFLHGRSAYLVYQLNDSSWNAIGPSLVHRAFLLESLSELECDELVFVHGCSGILRHACVPIMVNQDWIIQRSLAARAGAALIATFWPSAMLGRAAEPALEVTR